MNTLAPVPKLIRIYLSIKKIGEDYFEASYKDFYPDGTVAAYGCEDFSGERLKNQTKKYEVRVYNGKTATVSKAGNYIIEAILFSVTGSQSGVSFYNGSCDYTITFS